MSAFIRVTAYDYYFPTLTIYYRSGTVAFGGVLQVHSDHT
jgi:hypothetical protein